MNSNLFIRMYKSGKLISEYAGHNIWVDYGSEYLANLVSLSSYDPDVIIEDRRIKHIGFGIGGSRQTLSSIANSPPLSTSYPVAQDPHGTSGDEYKREFPINPMITSLERPVRITGGIGDYLTADPTNVWLTQVPAPRFMVTFPATGEVTFRSTVDSTKSEMLYDPFIEMPLSEVGLFLSGADVNSPYNVDPEQLVAYHSFNTQLFTLGVILELTWNVRF